MAAYFVKSYPICGEDYFTAKNFTVEEVQEIYYGYFENLIEYIRAYRAAVKFLPNAELRERPTDDYTIRDNTDRFINNGVSLQKLGRDVEENGTYWSFICYRNLVIKEGGHRHDGLRSINSSRKVMAVIIDDVMTGMRSQRILDSSYSFNLLFPEAHMKNFCKDTHIFSKFNKIGKSLYRVETNSLAEIDQIIIRYSMFTSWLLFEYRGKIKPVGFVNNEEEFKRWKVENNL